MLWFILFYFGGSFLGFGGFNFFFNSFFKFTIGS